MVNPVPGYRITTPYRRTGRLWSLGWHTGADWAAPAGTRVVAAAGGTVLTVARSAAFGLYVVIRSTVGGTTYRGYYAHLSATSVKVGQSVKTGQLIGRVGSTGNSTGPHLHLEARRAPFGFTAASIRNPSVLVGVPANAKTAGGGKNKGTVIARRDQVRWEVTASRLNARRGPGTGWKSVKVVRRGHRFWGARQTKNWMRSRSGRWFSKRYLRRVR